jgi:hypothetical protein
LARHEPLTGGRYRSVLFLFGTVSHDIDEVPQQA